MFFFCSDELSRLFACGPRISAGSDPEDNIEDDSKVEEKHALVEEADTGDNVETEIPNVVLSESVSPIPEPESQDVVDEKPIPDDVKIEPEIVAIKSPVVNSPSASVMSSTLSPKLSVHMLDDRITKMEGVVQSFGIPEHFVDGIAIMKDQLELAMDQLLLLTVLTLSKNPETRRVQQLYSLAQALRSIRKTNVYIESSNRLELHAIASIDWHPSELQLNEELSEEDILETRPTRSKDSGDVGAANSPNRFDLDGCVCYSPEKLLDQLMELKGEFCLLTNKVNELSARLLKQESQQTLALIQELQEQMRELKLASINSKEIQDRLQVRVTSNVQNIEDIKKNVEDVMVEKVDKTELDIILADKVDYNQLQRKVSLDQMLEVQCRIDKRFCEVFRQIGENDKKFTLTIESLKDTLGFAAIEGILQSFREQTNKEIHALHHLLQKYIESTNDECAAAGTRVKVLQDLACLSCDTTCVMRSMEKSKVAKLPSARATSTLSPLITYELGSIRKSGLMGYYRKDEFPHAPHAWMKRQDNGKTEKHEISRHAGGSHTTSTARERVDKVLLNKN